MAEEDYEDDYEEATPEEKLRIATHFILQSPPGHVKGVVADLQKLMNDDSVLPDSKVREIVTQYNVERLVWAKAGDAKVIVSPAGQLDTTHYVDPRENKVYEFDHVEGTFGDAADFDAGVGARTLEYRAAIDTEITKYAEELFEEAKVATAVYATAENQITIVISGQNLNLRNFWSGSWRSTYTLDISSAGSTSMSALIKLNVHYFEDGNVQLNTKFPQKADVDVAEDATATGTAVRKVVDSIESKFQKSLEEFYVNMHNETFKSMRRFLPISGTKMNWNSAAHGVAGEVGGS